MNECQHDALRALQSASHEVLVAQERLEAANTKYKEALYAHHRAVKADRKSWNAIQRQPLTR